MLDVFPFSLSKSKFLFSTISKRAVQLLMQFQNCNSFSCIFFLQKIVLMRRYNINNAILFLTTIMKHTDLTDLVMISLEIGFFPSKCNFSTTKTWNWWEGKNMVKVWIQFITFLLSFFPIYSSFHFFFRKLFWSGWWMIQNEGKRVIKNILFIRNTVLPQRKANLNVEVH